MLREKYSSLRSYFRLVRQRLPLKSTGSKHLGYIGGEGHLNLGDDAMFIAARRLLSRDLVVSFAHPQREDRLSGLGLGGGAYFDAAVLGGGTLINPPTVSDWIGKVTYALNQGLTVWAWGTGVGSSYSIPHKLFPDSPIPPTRVCPDVWRELLVNFKGIGVRGPRSQRALQEIGLGNVRVVGDLALGLAREKIKKIGASKKIAVNLTLPYGDRLEDYPVLMKVCDILDQMSQHGWQIIPVATCWTDKFALRQLLMRISSEPSQLHLPKKGIDIGRIDEFFNLVGSCQMMVAVRLHAAVLSCCVGVPPLMIVYREKSLDFMESMELERWCINLYEQDLSGIPNCIYDLMSESNGLREKILRRAQYWRRELQEYAEEMVHL